MRQYLDRSTSSSSTSTRRTSASRSSSGPAMGSSTRRPSSGILPSHYRPFLLLQPLHASTFASVRVSSFEWHSPQGHPTAQHQPGQVGGLPFHFEHFYSSDNSAPLKLCGFGVAVKLATPTSTYHGGKDRCHILSRDLFSGRVGVAQFMSPEVVGNEDYGTKVGRLTYLNFFSRF